MNPPRFEMEYSLKRFLSLKGINVRRTFLQRKSRLLNEAGESNPGAGRKRKHHSHIIDKKHETNN
jgi:hypothetical protein